MLRTPLIELVEITGPYAVAKTTSNTKTPPTPFFIQNRKFRTEVMEITAPRPLTTGTSPPQYTETPTAKTRFSTEDHKSASHHLVESEKEIREGEQDEKGGKTRTQESLDWE